MQKLQESDVHSINFSDVRKTHEFSFIFDSQGIFRRVLDAFANPGRLVSIAEYSDRINDPNRVSLALAATLIDNETRFHVSGDHKLTEAIRQFTYGIVQSLEESDFVFVTKPCNQGDIERILAAVSFGTLESPHLSATVIVRISRFGDALCRLRGPGIDGEIILDLGREATLWLNSRKEQQFEYPCGVDLIFLSDTGDLMAAPRLVNPARDSGIGTALPHLATDSKIYEGKEQETWPM